MYCLYAYFYKNIHFHIENHHIYHLFPNPQVLNNVLIFPICNFHFWHGFHHPLFLAQFPSHTTHVPVSLLPFNPGDASPSLRFSRLILSPRNSHCPLLPILFSLCPDPYFLPPPRPPAPTGDPRPTAQAPPPCSDKVTLSFKSQISGNPKDLY